MLQADNPDPKSELEYSTPFELLIAVVLSAQATDKSVNESTRHIFPIANTPEKLLEKITDKTKILIMPFPNNPTGAIMERRDLEENCKGHREA